MPRRPSLHVVQRGHNRQPCVFAEEDYHTCLRWNANCGETK